MTSVLFRIAFAGALCCLCLAAVAYAADATADADPYLDYEAGDAPGVAEWIEQQNRRTLERLGTGDRYQEFYQYILRELTADDRIVYPALYWNSDVVRNIWRDDEHPQGIIRETTLDAFFSGAPVWKTILDLDELSRAEGKTWVYMGVDYPYRRNDRGIIALSDGGQDATVLREFDYMTGEFVANGFSLPESKSGVDWLDADTLLVASAFEEADRTESGYPRVVKIWKRGTAFAQAETVFTAETGDLAAGAGIMEIDDGETAVLFVRQIDMFQSEYFIYEDGGAKAVLLPLDASLQGVHKRMAFIRLKSDWETAGRVFKAGSLVSCPYDELTSEEKAVTLFYEPAANASIESVDMTGGYLYLTTLEDVQTKISQYEFQDGDWRERAFPVSELATAGLASTPREKGFVLFVETGFLHPSSLYRVDEKTLAKTLVQSLPERFDASAYVARQYFAESADATRIPYFVVHKKDLPLDGTHPVHQTGYGGFMATMLPGYQTVAEYCWLRRGGVYVLANIRGGGEYGPSWHDAAQGTRRNKAFEDFIAVSEDLVRRGFTSPGGLGISGGSNGGLLTGAVMVMRPDLYRSVVIQVPLLDMLRYHKLPPGPSWISEYGNPDDPDVAAFWLKYSPYQNLKKGVRYPSPLIMTSSKDDRVHPGHARKFARRLEEFGQDFYYYEEREGGHSGNVNPTHLGRNAALMYNYLWERQEASDE